MRSVEVPVLIVGAGPSGLMASLLLERLGVETLVVERRPGPQRAPAAHVVNARTLEICRGAGVDMDALAAATTRPEDGSWVYFVTKLGGRELGRLPFERQGDDQLALTPTPLRNLSQNRFEPLLLEALSREGRAPRWCCEWQEGEAHEGGGRSVVHDLDRDERFEVQSRFTLAADGAGSRIRKALGIGMEGPDRLQSFVMVHFHASLRERIGSPPGVLFFVCDPDSGGGAFVIHDPDGEGTYMSPFDPDQEVVADYDAERCATLVRRALEDPSLPFEVESVSTWAMTAQVAERYRDGGTFLVGDAAHRFPPTGGLGLNTGIQDVHNLAWKLAAVLDGRGGNGLLASYESERLPVAQHNARQSLQNAVRLFEVPAALGIDGDVEASRRRMEKVLADPDGLQRVESVIAAQAEHFDMPGLQLGFAYTAGALVPDREAGDPCPGDVRRYEPCGAPGHRLPHAWIREGSASLLDWVPRDRLLLLVGPRGQAWIEALPPSWENRVVSRVLSEADLVDLALWLEQAGLEPDGALLVRPDQHVAWRARSLHENCRESLEHALNVVVCAERTGDHA